MSVIDLENVCLTFSLAGKNVSALKNINLKVLKGERIALIGRNGAGKSTLLKVIAGIYAADEGSCVVQGTVNAMLSPGAGLDSNATGIENIYLRCLLQGQDVSFVESKIDDIVRFADIGDYIEQPLHTYSSGMRLRLAFSIATIVQRDILLIDEWIGVGDEVFLEKARNRITEMIESGSTLVLASHNHGIVESFCDKKIRLTNGVIDAIMPTRKNKR